MGFLSPVRNRRPRRFEHVEEDDGQRIHFHRLNPYHRGKGRSILWLVVMIAFVAYLIFYLNQVKG